MKIDSSKKCIIFNYRGRFAHFLVAEANASAPSYPVPARTTILGLIGAIIGLKKDTPQTELSDAKIGISGKAKCSHWHTANLRKKLSPPLSLPYKVKMKKANNGGSKQILTQINQEWLFKPTYKIWTMLPEPYHNEFELRLKQKRQHFTPCLGLSEMIANIEYNNSDEIRSLPFDVHNVETIARKSEVEIDFSSATENSLVIKSMRMPREVKTNREFTHDNYFIELNDEPIPVKTSKAFQAGSNTIMWS